MAGKITKSIPSLIKAIEEGSAIPEKFTNLYDDALKLYGRFEGATQFEDRHRALELCVVNATEYTVEFDEEHFDSGTWFYSPMPLKIEPGTLGMMYVANRQGSILCGVSGGVRYKIAGTGKYLFMGFTNPEIGCYKNFVSVAGAEHGAEWAYDNCEDDTVKQDDVSGFHVTATIRPPKECQYKMFQYSINGSLLSSSTETPPDDQPDDQPSYPPPLYLSI